jgi:hypothetical protein
MIKITRTAYFSVPVGFRFVWSGIAGNPEWIGRKAISRRWLYRLAGIAIDDQSPAAFDANILLVQPLAVEGVDFEIIEEEQL